MSDVRTSVLIVGAGPTGLGLAIELGIRGVDCVVIERNDRVGYAPRAKTTHTRTREYLRRWGIAGDLAAASPFGVDYPSNVVFVTRLAGLELARFANAFNCAPARNDLYSEHAQWVPQYKLEEVLRARIETLPSVDLRFNVRFESAEQGPAGVVSRAIDAAGDVLTIESDYVVGADGARSHVRQAIGATMEGAAGRSRNFNIIFRAPGLAQAHPHGPAIMYWQINPELPSTIGPMDQGDLWFFMPSNMPADLELTDESAGALIRKATGIEMAYEILSSDEWLPNRLIADRYRRGRIFIAGDACHLHPPLGGYGMNMGVADSVDLGWKLAAVLDGWADPSLLDSYELERRPVHQRVIDEAVGNQTAHGAVMRPGLEAEGAEGEAARREVGDLIRQTRHQEFRGLGVVLGYTYAGSPFVATEAAPPPESPSIEYRPSAYPGRLAPHLWLDDGRSLYDLFGGGFTLLVTDEAHAADVAAASDDAARMRVPLEIVRVAMAETASLYEAALVLIRPDQHVAWRGAAWPGAEILARVTGRLGAARAEDPSNRLDAGSV
jgi:2-polyprenyl-6-methoxyphenol hydroxylase-like FAD-dependent oxidoreductase